MIHLRKRHVLVLLALLAPLLIPAVQVRAAPPAIAAKQAEAQAVLAQVRALDAQLGRSVEAYDRAHWQLRQTERNLARNGRELAVARRELAQAEGLLAARMVAIYESDQQNATLEVLLGAHSVGDVLDRLDAVRRVSAADVAVVRSVRADRARVELQRTRLERERGIQARLSARLATERASIQARLGERQRLLSSVKAEIVRLQAEERARQARLRREALARLAAQRAAEQRAEEEARAQAAARAAAARRQAQAEAERSQVQVEHRQAQAGPSSAVTAPTPAATTTEAAPPPSPPPPPETVVGVTAQTPEGASVAPPPSHGEVVDIAMRYLGVPYKWGGDSPSGFDCSGLVMYVYAQVGVSLPHYSAGQYGYGVPVSRDQLAPGDLVFFDGLDHVGIYIGGGQFIHAPHTGEVVKISSMASGFYSSAFVGARRI